MHYRDSQSVSENTPDLLDLMISFGIEQVAAPQWIWGRNSRILRLRLNRKLCTKLFWHMGLQNQRPTLLHFGLKAEQVSFARLNTACGGAQQANNLNAVELWLQTTR